MTLYLIRVRRSTVPRKRAYDGAKRAELARRSRDHVLQVARRELLSRGYAAVTIRDLAERAGVSMETIYKSFGGKPGLISAIYQRGLEGRGPTPAERRSESMVARENDPRVVARQLGRFVAEISPLAAPILLLVRAAAAEDPELAAVLRDSDAERLKRMRFNARSFARRGFLRPGLSIARAADICWALTAPELYEQFVVRRGWTARQLGEYVAGVLETAVLRDAGE
jgi:AcrR family transcriptional regulator